MNCPNCAQDMTDMTLERRMGGEVAIDVCKGCQAFWFDKYESIQLSPGSTLQLMKFIGEQTQVGKAADPQALRCPRCADHLTFTHDFQGSTRFTYWRCEEHGRFISFLDFLREKNFVRVLSREEVMKLREDVQIVNCSNCGAPIDLAKVSSCSHCGSPISILDMKQPQQLLEQLRNAAEPKPIDPALPLELARARRETERLFGPIDSEHDWVSDASSSGLVASGLNAMVRWLKNSGI
jgi:Zn-finger nucleic acid-binding protein